MAVVRAGSVTQVAMGFRLAVVLCVTFAVVARGQFVSTITNDLSSKENQLNCLVSPNLRTFPPAVVDDFQS